MVQDGRGAEWVSGGEGSFTTDGKLQSETQYLLQQDDMLFELTQLFRSWTTLKLNVKLWHDKVLTQRNLVFT